MQSDVAEVLENHIWIGVTWREAFVVPFIPGTVPGWSDACFEPVEWPGSGHPRSDGDQGWCIVRSPATDADGWVYGTAFDHLREDRPGGRASKRTNDRVRSRLWRRVDAAAHQQAATAQDDGSVSSSATAAASIAGVAGAAVGQAAASTAAAGKAALAGAVHAVQASVPGAVKRASFAGMVNTFLKLVKDAAARHNTVMITPDITGWFFVISTHSDELKRQQLGQLQQLVWFSQEQKLQESMRQCGLGTNPPGVILQGAAATLAALEASKQPQAAGGASTGGQDASQAPTTAAPVDSKAVGAPTARQGSATRSQQCPTASRSMPGASGTAGGQHVLRGQPFTGLKMHIGSGSSASKGANQQQPRTSTSSVSSSSGKVPGSPAAGSPAGVQLHVGPLTVLDDLLAGAQYSQAAYGYVAAAGHLSNLGNAIKMLATLPHFNAITGASLEANIRAMHTLAGFCPQDVLLAAWHNDTFRPCHYVAVDVKRGNIVLGVRGSLELGDLETDVTAAPLPFEFQGVAGWVHEGLLAAAAYVVSNTVDALAEAAQRCPGWPLVVAGHSLGGGVAALVTLLLQQPGAAPRGISGVRCITIGPPAVLSQELCGLCEEYITSIVLGADPIPRLSTFSVESLLLDLVNMSLSRRVTNQLAATTSSMAASTAGAINSLAAGISRLANTATTNMTSHVNTMKSSLASFKALPGFPLIDASLTSFSLGLAAADGSIASSAAAGAAAVAQALQMGEQYTLGTGSVELTRRQGLQQQEQGLAGLYGEVSDGGLKQVHAMLQDDREQRRASMEVLWHAHMPHLPQQQQQQEDAAAAVDGGVLDARRKLGELGLQEPRAAATQFDTTPGQLDAAAAPAQQHAAAVQANGSSTLQQQQPWGANSGSAAVPRWQKEHSSSSSKPGGPKLVSGGPTAANIMIFPKHDDANIITGIQEAWAGLKPRSSVAAAAAAADGSHSSSSAADGSSSGRPQGALHHKQQQRAPAAAAAASRSNSSSRRTAVTPFGIEQQARPSSAGAEPRPGSGAVGSAGAARTLPAAASAGDTAAAAAASPAAAGLTAGRVDSTSSSTSIKRCTSEPSLVQWASDGLQPLGEPSWAKLSRSSDGASAGQQQQQGGVDGGKGDAAGGGVGDSTVHALESDLKKTARLYPPGRIFWILSEELVGPAAHQLMTAVAAHLTPAAATAAASAAAAAKQQASTSGSTTSNLRPPSPAEMNMPTSVMGPGSKPTLRTQPKHHRQQQNQQPQHQQQDPLGAPAAAQHASAPPSVQQQHAVSSRTAARDAATAHAVAAASAKHILQDVHSLDARRAAAAALQAAQHEHPPLHLQDQQSPQDTAAQLEQQLRQQQEDMQAGEVMTAADAADNTPQGAEVTAVGGVGNRGQQAAGGSRGDSKQQVKPLRTLRMSNPSSVQMSTAAAASPAAPMAAGVEQDAASAQAAAAAVGEDAAGAPAAAAAAQPANRSSSGPMEVDGSAAGRAAGHGWPTSWGSTDGLNPEDLPQELQELLQILGTPCDAASALAIGYKKQVLLQHFWQQRQREASAAAAAIASSCRGTGSSSGGSSRRVRSCSDSHLMQFEDMIRAADDIGSAEGAAAAANGTADAVIPHLELVDHSWWGTVSSLGSRNKSSGGGSKATRQQGSAAAIPAVGQDSGASGAAAAAQACNTAGPESGLRRGLPLGPSHRLDGDGPTGDAKGSGAAAAGAAARDHQAGAVQAAAQPPQQQQQVELALLQKSDDYVVWAAQQAALHQRQQQQQRQQQDAAAAAAAAEVASKQQLSLPELAAESLVELAQLPERIAESFGGLKFGAGSNKDTGEDEGCGDLAPGAAAGLAALCAPVLNPVGSDGAPAAQAAVGTNGMRLPPVVVMPDRDVFSRLLLHRTAVLDHLPSNYVKVLTEMKEAFSSMHLQQ